MHLLIPAYLETKHQWSFDVTTYAWAAMPMLGDWIFSLGYMPYTGRNNLEVMHLVTSGSRLEPPNGTPNPVGDNRSRKNITSI